MSRAQQSGFTLVEALAALAITAALLTGLGAVAGQWLPHWRHGFLALQNADVIGLALDRMTEDIASAEYARFDAGQGAPLFRGEPESVAFVRRAIGPGAGPRLEVVRIGAFETAAGVEVTRAHAAFAPGKVAEMRDHVALLKPPFRVVFAYAAKDGAWRTRWLGEAKLPRAMRLQVQSQGGVAVVSTTFALKVTAAPEIAAQPDSQAPAGASKKNE